MPELRIDPQKCAKDGICVAECPFGLIEEAADKTARFIDQAESLCIECGHCLAICPTGAVSIDGLQQAQLDPVRRDLAPGKEQMTQLLRTRRSTRGYKDQPVPRELLEELVDLTRWAPTARNQQTVHWLLVAGREQVRELAALIIDWLRAENLFPGMVARWDKGRDPVLRDAPVLAAVHAPEQGYRPEVDCSIALASLELAAPAHGLGACWAGFFMNASGAYAPLRERLPLPEGHKIFGALMLGYPKYRYRYIPTRKPARITWL